MLDRIVNIFSKLYTVLLLPHGVHARIDVDLILRCIFGFYYVPLVLYTLLVGANVALQFVYVTLLPTVQDLPLLNLVNQNNQSLASAPVVDRLETVAQEALMSATLGGGDSSPGFKFSSLFYSSTATLTEDQLQMQKLLDVSFAHVYFWMSEVFTALLPHATFFFCLMAMVHKLVTASGEACVDTMSYYRGLDYPLLYSTVKVSILASGKRRALSILVGITLLYSLYTFASGFIQHVVSTRPASVIAAVWANIAWCGLYLVLSFISAFIDEKRRRKRLKDDDDDENEEKEENQNSGDRQQRKRSSSSSDQSFWTELQWLQSRFGFDSTWSLAAAAASAVGSPLPSLSNKAPSSSSSASSTNQALHHSTQSRQLASFFGSPNQATSNWIREWWKSHVNFIRHISMSFLLCFVVYWTISEGPLQAFRYFVETLIALNVPNLCIYVTLKIVVALIRTYYGFNWLTRHANEGWITVVFLLSLPYLIILCYTASFVSSTSSIFTAAALAWATIQIVGRCILLCREHDVSGHHIAWYTVLTHHHQHQHDHYAEKNRNDSGKDTTGDEHNQKKHKRKNSCVDNSSLSVTPIPGQSRSASNFVSATTSPSVSALLQQNDSLHADPLTLDQNTNNDNNQSNKNTSSNNQNNKSSSPAGDGINTNSPAQVVQQHTVTKTTTQKVTTTKRRVAPAIAALLENAFECGAPTTTETISLELEADLTEMKLFKRGLVMDLVRETTSTTSSDSSSDDDENESKEKTQQKQNTDEQQQRTIPVLSTTARLFPRLFLFQSSPSFSGARFQMIRTVLRIVSGTLLGVFVLLVVALVAQESMEILTPLPLNLNCLSGSDADDVCHDLVFDHLVIKLRLQTFPASEREKSDKKREFEQEDSSLPSILKKARDEMYSSSSSSSSKSLKAQREAERIDGGPICDVEAVKGNSSTSVHVWELSWLSLLPYLGNMKNVTTFLATVNYALGTDWEILPFAQQQCSTLHHHQSTNHINNNQKSSSSASSSSSAFSTEPQHEGLSRRPRRPWRSFMRLRSPSRNVTVIAIRGTDMTSVLDCLQDVDMYLESFVYHLASHLIPGIRMLPGQIVRDLIRLSSEAWPQDGVSCIERGCLRDDAVRSERRYYDIVLRYLNNDAESFAEKMPNDKILLTGHSLAGAIGAIVASRFPLAHRSFGFSAPGVELSMYKFGIESPDLVRRKATTVVSDNDIVPHIGGAIGATLPLACHDFVKERCHAMESIVNSFWKVCKREVLMDRFPNVKDVSLN